MKYPNYFSVVGLVLLPIVSAVFLGISNLSYPLAKIVKRLLEEEELKNQPAENAPQSP